MSTSASPEEKPAKGKPKAMLILPLAVVVILLGLMAYALNTGDPSRLPSVLIGKPAPEFTLTPVPRLETEAGTPVPGFSSSVLKNGKVTLLNVWASWCAPCAVEHPQLVDLAKQGIPIYGMNYKGDTADAARRFLQRHGNPFLAVGMDTTGMTGIDFGVYGVPETFVIDGAGRIVLRYPGPLTAEVIADKIMPAVRKAEKDTAPARS
jgi:cytochrome c biogenesis protein CcmG, thiol:disulfide interchange protein DsbE